MLEVVFLVDRRAAGLELSFLGKFRFHQVPIVMSGHAY
jgi:hypothetical protein